MWETWWDIENIARLHFFVDDGVERFNLQQIRMRAVLFQGDFFPNTPATAANTLNDKHVVLVVMRANAAAWYRERDHQIVNSPVR
ncbi:hypothetical protein D3C75_814270 [compost metagenome]